MNWWEYEQEAVDLVMSLWGSVVSILDSIFRPRD